MAAVLPVEALAVHAALLGLFAVQQSVVARPATKRWRVRFVPASIFTRSVEGPAARVTRLISRSSEFVLAVVAEYGRARIAARRYSDLRGMDVYTLAKHGMTVADIPRRVFDECYSLDRLGTALRHGHAATPPRMGAAPNSRSRRRPSVHIVAAKA